MIRGFLLLISLVVTLVPSPAQAHMTLLRSDPADGAVLDQAPREAVLEFNKPLGQTAYVILTGPNGSIPTPDPTVTGKALTVAITDAGEGGYRLAFRAVSAEGHPLTGAIVYTVGASNDGDTPAEEAPVTRGHSDSTNQRSWFPVGVGGAVLICGGAGLTFWLLRRRRVQAASDQ